MSDIDYTRKFNVNIDKDQEIKMILSSVYNSLQIGRASCREGA